MPHILMLESVKDLDLPQRSLAVGLVLKWPYFLNGHLLLGLVVNG